MTPPPPARLTLAAALAALLIACDSGERGNVDASGKADPGPIPASPQRPGDPTKGYDALVNRAVVTCGLPVGAYRKAIGKRRPDLGPRLPGRIGPNADLPYPLTAYRSASGVELVTPNCLVCHAAPLDGKLIVGLGNAFLDMTQDPLIEVGSVGAQVSGKTETAEWRRWAERIGAVADYIATDTVGVNSADNLTRALIAHRDPKTLAWSARPLIAPPPEQPLPVAVPPWWGLGKKHALFYSGQGRGDQARHMTLVAGLCTDSVEEARAMDAWMVDLRAYLATLKPPAYPYPIDRALSEGGRRIFERECTGCHGAYGEKPSYPNRVIALGKVGTDPELARSAFADADRFRDWLSRSFYGELSQATPALGYIAPPLDGIWATAPYLHNDSVPTLADLLESPGRPAYWRFRRTSEDAPIYDPQRLGWSYEILVQGKSAAMSWDERNRIYDTSGKGYGNDGHDFGDALSAQERLALIEYLKTL